MGWVQECVALAPVVVTHVGRRPPWGLLLVRMGERPAGGGCVVKVDSAPAFLLFLGCSPLVGAPPVRGEGPPGLLEPVGLVVAAVLSSCSIRPEMRVLGSCAATLFSLVEVPASWDPRAPGTVAWMLAVAVTVGYLPSWGPRLAAVVAAVNRAAMRGLVEGAL